MKKFLIFLLALSVLCSFAACAAVPIADNGETDSTPRVNATSDPRPTPANTPGSLFPSSSGLTGEWERVIADTRFSLTYSSDGTGLMDSAGDSLTFTYTDDGETVVMTNMDGDVESLGYLISEDGNVLFLYEGAEMEDYMVLVRTGANLDDTGNADFDGAWYSDDGYAVEFAGNQMQLTQNGSTTAFSYAMMPGNYIALYSAYGEDYLFAFHLSGNTLEMYNDVDQLVLHRGTAPESESVNSGEGGLVGVWSRTVDGETAGFTLSADGSGLLISGAESVPFTYDLIDTRTVELINEAGSTEQLEYIVSLDQNLLCLYPVGDPDDCILFLRGGDPSILPGETALNGDWVVETEYGNMIFTFDGNRMYIHDDVDMDAYYYALLPDGYLAFCGDNGTDYIYGYELSRDENTLTLLSGMDELVLTRS